MIRFSHIDIVQFKNLRAVKLDFKEDYVCFTGDNGAGKTNLLDAIYYLSIGKSFFNPVDQLNILHGEDYFNLTATVKANDTKDEVFCGFVKGKKKKIKRNGKEYDRLSDHIGNYPVVIVTPYDNSLITGGSEERRKFTDLILSQLDHDYLEKLMAYNKALKQRNAQLKLMFEKDIRDRTLLEVYNEVLIENAGYIHKKRREFFGPFSTAFNDYYNRISDETEQVSLHHQSGLYKASMKELLDSKYELDIATQRTNSGPHKDDLLLEIFDHPAKKFASQGQQKSMLLSLKLAQYDILKEEKKLKPVFLLDDIFDRLDQKRITQLMKLITNGNFGQVFITDTNKNRILKVFNKLGKEVNVIELDKGKVLS